MKAVITFLLVSLLALLTDSIKLTTTPPTHYRQVHSYFYIQFHHLSNPIRAVSLCSTGVVGRGAYGPRGPYEPTGRFKGALSSLAVIKAGPWHERGKFRFHTEHIERRGRISIVSGKSDGFISCVCI